MGIIALINGCDCVALETEKRYDMSMCHEPSHRVLCTWKCTNSPMFSMEIRGEIYIMIWSKSTSSHRHWGFITWWMVAVGNYASTKWQLHWRRTCMLVCLFISTFTSFQRELYPQDLGLPGCWLKRGVLHGTSFDFVRSARHLFKQAVSLHMRVTSP